MTSLLYYSYSSYLTEDERVEIDKQVKEDREKVYLFVKELPLNSKRKTIRVIIVIGLGFSLKFSSIQSGEAIDTTFSPQQTIVVVNTTRLDGSRLIKLSNLEIKSDLKSKIMIPSLSNSIESVRIRIRTKSDLQNSQWLKEFISSIRGGDDEKENEKLVKSILSKISKDEWDLPSINKILKNIVDITLNVGANDHLVRMLAELQKPIPESASFVGGFSNPLSLGQYSSTSTPSIESLLDRTNTKCYAHREANNMPRSVSENFKTRAVKKVSKASLKDPSVKREYELVKFLLKEGIHPKNLSRKSTFVSSTKVLVKKSHARYLVEVSDSKAEILGMSIRSDSKMIGKFETLMNKLYNLNLKGY